VSVLVGSTYCLCSVFAL